MFENHPQVNMKRNFMVYRFTYSDKVNSKNCVHFSVIRIRMLYHAVEFCRIDWEQYARFFNFKSMKDSSDNLYTTSRYRQA